MRLIEQTRRAGSETIQMESEVNLYPRKVLDEKVYQPFMILTNHQGPVKVVRGAICTYVSSPS